MKENQLQVQNQPTPTPQPPPPSSRVNASAVISADLHQLIEPKSTESENIERILMKTIIERGASWTLEETRLLLLLWGQDEVQKQTTCLKRTKEMYEKISESFAQNGYVRTPDQVRTRVFNMIAEYRRILKDPNPDRRKKCIFFEPLHKIYQAKNMDDVKSALDDHENSENPYSPASNTIMSDRGDESISDGDALDDILVTGGHAASNNNNNNNNNINSDNATNSNSNDGPQSNNNKNNNKTSATSENNGDSNHDSNNDTTNNATQPNNKDTSEKDSASTSNHQSTSSSAKKIKLESSSPKASTSQAAGDNKIKTYQATGLPVGYATTNLSGVKQQSLLLPHGATTVSASTQNNKSTTSGNNMPPSLLNIYSNINSTKTMPVIRTNQFLGHANGNESTININGTPTTATRLPTTAAITGHQLYQAPVNTFDVTSSALLIDRMFAHLSRESENMRDWIALEKERIALERARRAQETEREVRRERVLIDTLMRFHESWISFIGRLDPKLVEAAAADNQLPELNIPPRESGDKQQPATEQVTSQTNSTTSGPTTPSQSSSAATSSTASAATTAAIAATVAVSTTASASTNTTTTTTSTTTST